MWKKRIAAVALLLCCLLTACVPGIRTGGRYNEIWDAAGEDEEVFGIYDEETGTVKAAPLPSDIGYVDEILTRKTGVKLTPGNYAFDALMSIDNNTLATAKNNFENDIVSQLRVISVSGKTRESIASREIYRWDFNKAYEFETQSLTFSLAKSAVVDLEIKYLNSATFEVKQIGVRSIAPEEVLRLDYAGYFAESEADAKLSYDPDALYFFDMYEYILPIRDSRFGYDVIFMTAVLQGLANRDGNRIFMRFNNPNEHMYDQDGFWLKELQKPGKLLHGREVVTVERPATFLRLFRDRFNGLAVWDEKVPATSNVAATDCGVNDNLPVRYSVDGGGLYHILTEKYGLPVSLDLQGRFKDKKAGKIWQTNTPSTLSAKNDAYLWAYEKYMLTGKVSATVMADHLDAYTWDKSRLTVTYYNLQQQVLANKDYYIANKAFFWDLYIWEDSTPNDDPDQAVGTDAATLDKIMTRQNYMAGGELVKLGGFIPWWIKYTASSGCEPQDVQSEWYWATKLGLYYAVKDADAYGWTSVANCSVYARVETPEFGYTQAWRKTAGDNSPNAVKARAAQYLTDGGKVKDGNYVLVYMGDYDAGAWLTMSMPAAFTDPNRGKIPLCWPINPSPGNRVPQVFQYMYENQGPNDYFVGDHNGYGYIELVTLDSDDRPAHLRGDLDAYFRVTQTAWDFYDLDMMGFLINSTQPNIMYGPRVIKKMGDLAPYGVGYASGGGGNVVFRADSSGREVAWHGFHGDIYGGGEEAGRAIVARLKVPQTGSGGTFGSLRSILRSPSFAVEMIEQANRMRKELNIVPVDPYVYEYLIRVQYNKTE
ncbi:MAG: hypothetical protein LBL66_09855 [Clostridiales bacterium]|jgi:hypothetical protein|nr:hypothetical protein [Clostridiales bacterium]